MISTKMEALVIKCIIERDLQLVNKQMVRFQTYSHFFFTVMRVNNRFLLTFSERQKGGATQYFMFSVNMHDTSWEFIPNTTQPILDEDWLECRAEIMLQQGFGKKPRLTYNSLGAPQEKPYHFVVAAFLRLLNRWYLWH